MEFTLGQVKEVLNNVGEFATGKSLSIMSNLGVSEPQQFAGILSLIIFSSLIYLGIKFLNIARKPLKWLIIVGLIFIASSIALNLFSP